MQLKETCSMMCSTDYKERFIAEYRQLENRCFGLLKMVNKWERGKLDFEPNCPISLYRLQLRAMQDYLAILEARAKIEGIEIHHEVDIEID